MFAAINYHYIRENFDSLYPSIFGRTPKAFSEQLDILNKVGKFVSASNIKDAIENKKSLPENSICITFDDGLREQFDLALPILNKKGIPAIFFVNTASHQLNPILQYVHKLHILRSYISPDEILSFLCKELSIKANNMLTTEESLMAKNHYKYDFESNAILKYFINFKLSQRTSTELLNKLFDNYFRSESEKIAADLYMSKEQLVYLARLGYLGSHGHNHYPIGTLPIKEKKAEIINSAIEINKITNTNAICFSYPYGSKSSAENCEEVLKQNGFSFAFTMERAINHNLSNPFYLSRLDNNDVPLGKAYKYSDINFFSKYPAREWML